MANRRSLDSRKIRHGISAATLIVTTALCVYWGALFYGTHTKIPPGMLPGNSDKIIHFAAYAGLGVLFMLLRATRGSFAWQSVVARWVVLAGYGAFDELTQLLVNRNADVIDWCADVVGVTFGLGIVTICSWYFRRSPTLTRMVTPMAGGAQT